MLINQAKETGKMANFKRRRLNMWVKADDTWVPKDLWDACAGAFPSDYLSYPCWMGLDLADNDDINALVCVWLNEDTGKIYVKPYFWCPEDTATERTRTGFVPYLEWGS